MRVRRGKGRLIPAANEVVKAAIIETQAEKGVIGKEFDHQAWDDYAKVRRYRQDSVKAFVELVDSLA